MSTIYCSSSCVRIAGSNIAHRTALVGFGVLSPILRLLPEVGTIADPGSRPALCASSPAGVADHQSTPKISPTSPHSTIMTACTGLLHARQVHRVTTSLFARHTSRHRTRPPGVRAHQAATLQACSSTGIRLGLLRCRAAVDGADGQQPTTSPSGWDTQTGRLVSVSTIFFLLLLVPQILQNASSLMAGNSSALAALSWVVCPA